MRSFFNNVAQIRLVTDDPDVFDTVSITKMYDGEKGEAGQSGSGGLSVILGNEAQNIACTSGGLVQSAVEVTIPFTGYVGDYADRLHLRGGCAAFGCDSKIQYCRHRLGLRRGSAGLCLRRDPWRRFGADGNH